MTEKFLALAKVGKNQWWRYLLSILLILVFWQGAGIIFGVLLVILVQNDQNPATLLDPETFQIEGVDNLLLYLVLNLAFVGFLIGVYLAVRFIHQRPFRTLITPKNKIDWNKILLAFGIYLILLAVTSIIESLLSPGNYKLTFVPGKFLILLPLALFFTSIQTSVEEFFFRGYLMQGIGLTTRRAIVPILGSGILFMLPHLLNPEVKAGFFLLAAYYFVFGIFLAWITVKDNTLELALAAHASNNLYNVLIANLAEGALPSYSIFTIQRLDPVYNLVSSLVVFAVFYWFFFGRKRRENITE